MSAYIPSPAFTQFQEQLERLRTNIRLLSETQQPVFHLLADQADSHRRSMEEACLRVRSLVDDMRLREASFKFNLWAIQSKVQDLLAGEEDVRTGR